MLLCQPEGPRELAALLRGIAACEDCCFRVRKAGIDREPDETDASRRGCRVDLRPDVVGRVGARRVGDVLVVCGGVTAVGPFQAASAASRWL